MPGMMQSRRFAAGALLLLMLMLLLLMLLLLLLHRCSCTDIAGALTCCLWDDGAEIAPLAARRPYTGLPA